MKCEHSLQDMYIERATGRRGCNECDEAKPFAATIAIDPTMPRDEIRFVGRGGQALGSIINIGPSDHTSCSRRRFGSGCVPFEEIKNES